MEKRRWEDYLTGRRRFFALLDVFLAIRE